MWVKTGLAAAVFIAVASPAVAADCIEPAPMQVTVVGATASEDEMKAAIAKFKEYDKAVASFRDCVAQTIKQMDEDSKAKTGKPADPAMTSGLIAKSQEALANDERAGGQTNAQILAYKAAHPKPKS